MKDRSEKMHQADDEGKSSIFLNDENQSGFFLSQKDNFKIGSRPQHSNMPFFRCHLIALPRSQLKSLRMIEEEDGWLFEIGYRHQHIGCFKSLDESLGLTDEPDAEKWKHRND